jgi:hypothetical protein
MPTKRRKVSRNKRNSAQLGTSSNRFSSRRSPPSGEDGVAGVLRGLFVDVVDIPMPKSQRIRVILNNAVFTGGDNVDSHDNVDTVGQAAICRLMSLAEVTVVLGRSANESALWDYRNFSNSANIWRVPTDDSPPCDTFSA